MNEEIIIDKTITHIHPCISRIAGSVHFQRTGDMRLHCSYPTRVLSDEYLMVNLEQRERQLEKRKEKLTGKKGLGLDSEL